MSGLRISRPHFDLKNFGGNFMGKVKERICGIYCIENIINHKKYIGQSVNIYDREYHHFNSLRHGTHHNEFLQADYNIYKEDSFIFYIVQECQQDMLDWYEIFYINEWNLLNGKYGYNINPGGACPHVFSELELQKRSESIKTKWEDMDDNMRQHILNSLQNGYQNWITNRTQQEKEDIYNRRAKTMLSKSEEELAEINKKRADAIHNTALNRSKERRKEIGEIYRKSNKQRWDNMSPESKEKLSPGGSDGKESA